MGDLSGLSALLSRFFGMLTSAIHWYFSLGMIWMAVIAAAAFVGYKWLRWHLRK